jgi:hypothetical protein
MMNCLLNFMFCRIVFYCFAVIQIAGSHPAIAKRQMDGEGSHPKRARTQGPEGAGTAASAVPGDSPEEKKPTEQLIDRLGSYRSSEEKNRIEEGRLILNHIFDGACANTVDKYGWNAMHSASYVGDTLLLDSLIWMGGSRNKGTVFSGKTAPMLAALAGNIDALVAMIGDASAGIPPAEIFNTSLASNDGRNIYHYVLEPFYFKDRLYEWSDNAAEKLIDRLSSITIAHESSRAHFTFNKLDKKGRTPLDVFRKLAGRSDTLSKKLRALGFKESAEILREDKDEKSDETKDEKADEKSELKISAADRREAETNFIALMQELKREFARAGGGDIAFYDLAKMEMYASKIDLSTMMYQDASLFRAESLFSLAVGGALVRGPHDRKPKGSINLLRLVLHLGFDVNSISAPLAQTPLMVAVRGGRPEMVRWLLQLGADPLWQDENYQTVLHWLFRGERALHVTETTGDLVRVATMLIEATRLAGGVRALSVLDRSGRSPCSMISSTVAASQKFFQSHIQYFRARGLGIYDMPQGYVPPRERPTPTERQGISSAAIKGWFDYAIRVNPCFFDEPLEALQKKISSWLEECSYDEALNKFKMFIAQNPRQILNPESAKLSIEMQMLYHHARGEESIKSPAYYVDFVQNNAGYAEDDKKQFLSRATVLLRCSLPAGGRESICDALREVEALYPDDPNFLSYIQSLLAPPKPVASGGFGAGSAPKVVAIPRAGAK